MAVGSQAANGLLVEYKMTFATPFIAPDVDTKQVYPNETPQIIG